MSGENENKPNGETATARAPTDADYKFYLASNMPTLRDSFAMSALTGLISAEFTGDLVTEAYAIADDMLEERAKAFK